MKTSISIPDDVFEQAEPLARATQKSRSQLYSDTLREYLSRHASEEVTARMNHVLSQLDEPADPFVAAAAARTLVRSKW
jgi:metal-responsive CopG/Arc/MetJ family transcriptional regulator